jgi:hypothetical protein
MSGKRMVMMTYCLHLLQAELAVLAAGPPAERPDDLAGWKRERNRFDGLVRRQKKLAAAAEPLQPRRSERLEKKMLFVSKEWLQKERPTLKRVEAGTPMASADERRVQRRISATSTTPRAAVSIPRPRWSPTLSRRPTRAPPRRSDASIEHAGERTRAPRLQPCGALTP